MATFDKPQYGSRARGMRPPPKTWQEAAEDEARDLWDRQYGWVTQEMEAARGRRDRTTAHADETLREYQSLRPSATEGFRYRGGGHFAPTFRSAGGGTAYTSLMELQPSRVSDAGALQGFDAASVRYDPEALRALSFEALEGYDPSAYGETFARGAYGTFQRGLADELEALEHAGARAGRLRTGHFTGDQSRTVARVAKQFTDRLAEAATAFAGQRLSALQSGAQMRLARAQGIDDIGAGMARARGELALRRAEGIDANALRASEARDRLMMQQLAQAAELELRAAEMDNRNARELAEFNWRDLAERNRYDFEQRRYRDDYARAVGTTGLEAALARERMERDEAARALNRMSEYASATREWARDDAMRGGRRTPWYRRPPEASWDEPPRREMWSVWRPQQRPPEDANRVAVRVARWGR